MNEGQDKGGWYPQVTNFNKSENKPKEKPKSDEDKDIIQKRLSDMDLMK